VLESCRSVESFIFDKLKLTGEENTYRMAA